MKSNVGLTETCVGLQKDAIGSSPLLPNIDSFSKFFYVLN